MDSLGFQSGIKIWIGKVFGQLNFDTSPVLFKPGVVNLLYTCFQNGSAHIFVTLGR